tara:strand:+ start:3322 stop:4047 length:726 start_codon:yes stop_codon:yes gene_type:complete
MAKVTFGGGVSNIQGSIGGNCFTRTRAGVAVRNRVKPNNPATAAQMRQRNAFTRIAKHWKQVSEENRLSWESLAHESRTRGTCGNIIAMTGFAAFMQMNLNRFAMNEAVIDVPDNVAQSNFVANMWGSPQAFVIETNPYVFTFPLGDGAAEGQQYEVFGSGPYRAGQKKNFKDLKFMYGGTLDAGDISAGYLDPTTDTFYELFGDQSGTSGKMWTIGCRQYSKSIFSVPTIMVTEVDGSDP